MSDKGPRVESVDREIRVLGLVIPSKKMKVRERVWEG